MSYDLFLRGRDGAPIDRGAFEAHLRARRHYRVEAGHAQYGNDDTGVYFHFDHDEQSGVVAFNLNYFRPHVFALEAEPEVSAFVEALGCSVDDPQVDGMARGPYRREGFLRGWDAGNLAAHRAFLEHGGDRGGLLTLPAATIERYWRWNLARAELAAELGDAVFVPKVRYFQEQGRVLSSVIWGDAVPIALPEVDRVVVVRDALRTDDDGDRPAFAVVDGAAARAQLAAFPARPGPVACVVGRWDPPHPGLVDWFRAQPSREGTLDGASLDRVLCAELVDAASQRGSA